LKNLGRYESEAEEIFAYAVALEQQGRQKNTIFCFKDIIYIVNYDKTIVMKFLISNSIFDSPVGFFANDYDSPQFYIEDDKIVFLKKESGLERKKYCKPPDQDFAYAEVIFNKFYPDNLKELSVMSLHKNVIGLLDENLSHVEFVGRDKKMQILQRDIYTGSLIEIKKFKSGTGVTEGQDSIFDFSPLGMRYIDFAAMFAFMGDTDQVKFYFNCDKSYFVVEGPRNSMKAIVAGCLYDDIGTINIL
jgi:hypothetical protein